MASLADNLARLDALTAELQSIGKAINTNIREIEDGGNPVQTAVAYHNTRESYEGLDEARKGIYEMSDRLNKFLVPQALEKAGTDSIRIPSLARSFYIVKKFSATIIGPKEAAYDWLRENGLSELVQPTVNAGTLTNALKTLILEEGRDAPEELFKFSSYNTTGSSKYTPK